MMLKQWVWFLLSKENEPGGSPAPNEDEDDLDIDGFIAGLLDGDDPEPDTGTPDHKDTPKKDPEFTKAFSKRLNAEREKIAKQFGYDSWDEAQNAASKQRFDSIGVDPSDPEFQKILDNAVKERIESDPEIKRLREENESIKLEKAKKWEQDQLQALKAEYGVEVKSLATLDKKVQDFMKKGLDLVDAYYLVNKDKIKSTNTKEGGTGHLKPTGSGGGGSDSKVIVSDAEIAEFKQFAPSNLSDEDIRNKIIALRGGTKK